jgi:hypothetical protein
MHKSLWFLFLFNSSVLAAELQEETEVKFAIFSSAWGENTDDGLRVVAYNQTQGPIRLNTILFLKEESEDSEQVAVNLNLEIPSLAYADVEFPYIDLLQGNECIERTMAESWKLVEISNYTLNPSVRNLIIEDTDSFRIYQCIENVRTIWTHLASNIQVQYEEWVLFHFESRRDN